jgi:hypothetical protein
MSATYISSVFFSGIAEEGRGAGDGQDGADLDLGLRGARRRS